MDNSFIGIHYHCVLCGEGVNAEVLLKDEVLNVPHGFCKEHEVAKCAHCGLDFMLEDGNFAFLPYEEVIFCEYCAGKHTEICVVCDEVVSTDSLVGSEESFCCEDCDDALY